MGWKLLGGAVGVLGALRDVTGHAAWYLRYLVDGTPRDDDSPGAQPPS